MLDKNTKISYSEMLERIQSQSKTILDNIYGIDCIVIKGDNSISWLIAFFASCETASIVIPVTSKITVKQLDDIERIFGKYFLFDADTGRGLVRGLVSKVVGKGRPCGICLISSGSTKAPKYVCRNEESFIQEGLRYKKVYSPQNDDCILVALPLSHAFILGMVIGMMAVSGCSFYLHRHFYPRSIQTCLSKEKITILPLVSATAYLLCETYNVGSPRPINLKKIIIGAGYAPLSLISCLEQKLGIRPFLNYGASETGATIGTWTENDDDGITGFPFPEVTCKLKSIDGRTILFIKSANSFSGYYTDRGLVADKIDENGFYNTEDIATIKKNGSVIVHGRVTDICKKGGKSIDLGEVRQLLLLHPYIVGVVLKSYIIHTGDSNYEAHILTNADGIVRKEDITVYLKEHLEEYKLPSRVFFHKEFPEGMNGKIDIESLTTVIEKS